MHGFDHTYYVSVIKMPHLIEIVSVRTCRGEALQRAAGSFGTLGIQQATVLTSQPTVIYPINKF